MQLQASFLVILNELLAVAAHTDGFPGALQSQARVVLGVQCWPQADQLPTGTCRRVHAQQARSNSSEHKEILLGPHAAEIDALNNGREAAIILREQPCSQLARTSTTIIAR
eukprot:1137446-Pelagomonas_calceolata.AAC.17